MTRLDRQILTAKKDHARTLWMGPVCVFHFGVLLPLSLHLCNGCRRNVSCAQVPVLFLSAPSSLLPLMLEIFYLYHSAARRMRVMTLEPQVVNSRTRQSWTSTDPRHPQKKAEETQKLDLVLRKTTMNYLEPNNSPSKETIKF